MRNIITVGAVLAGLAIVGAGCGAATSSTTSSNPAAPVAVVAPVTPVTAPATVAPATVFIVALQNSQYWSQLSGLSNADLLMLGNGACTDITNGDDFYGVANDAAGAASEAGVSALSLDFLVGDAVQAFCPQYLPVAELWTAGNPSATANDQ